MVFQRMGGGIAVTVGRAMTLRTTLAGRSAKVSLTSRSRSGTNRPVTGFFLGRVESHDLLEVPDSLVLVVEPIQVIACEVVCQ